MKRRAVALVMGIALGVGALLVPEALLRWFRPDDGYSQYDPETRWSLRPGFQGKGPDLPDAVLSYSVRINDAGFRGGPISRPKPADVVRVAILGDSVTFGFGVGEEDTLPAKVAAMLSSQVRPKSVEWINAGVPGFSSLQGLRHLELRVLPFSPDIVIVLFGWNDGWRATAPDTARTGAGYLQAGMQSSHLVSFLKRGSDALARRLGLNPPTPPGRVPRVAPEEFAGNLLKIADRVRRAGGLPILVTLPAAFGPDRPPDRYFRLLWTVPRAELEPMRLRCSDAVRRGAVSASIPLVDCAHLVPSDPALFLEDGYHPDAAGFQVMARTIAAAIREAHLLSPQPVG